MECHIHENVYMSSHVQKCDFVLNIDILNIYFYFVCMLRAARQMSYCSLYLLFFFIPMSNKVFNSFFLFHFFRLNYHWKLNENYPILYIKLGIFHFFIPFFIQ